jgi:hypothetical protein
LAVLALSTVLTLSGVRLLMLAALPGLVIWVVAALLLTDIGRLVVPLLLICHHEFSCC